MDNRAKRRLRARRSKERSSDEALRPRGTSGRDNPGWATVGPQQSCGFCFFRAIDEENIVYLWTFSGEKINRVIEILLSTELEAEIDCDYKQVRIDFRKISPKPIDELQELLSSFKTMSREDLESIAMEKIQVKWFSKFSDCLPDSLAKQTIFEKDYDLAGLMRELSTITINDSSNLLLDKNTASVKQLPR